MRVPIDKNQSLLNTAFEVLLHSLGPQKTSQLWQILAPAATSYTDIRQKLFKGKGVSNLYRQAKRFNRK